MPGVGDGRSDVSHDASSRVRAIGEDGLVEGITTASDVASSAVGGLMFAGLLALWIRFVIERIMPISSRRRWVRRWNWGTVWFLVVTSSCALLVAAWMALTGTTFH